MNYKLYQIQLTEAEHNQVNAEGHNSVPKHRAKLDMSFTDKVAELASDAFSKGYYTHVSNRSYQMVCSRSMHWVKTKKNV